MVLFRKHIKTEWSFHNQNQFVLTIIYYKIPSFSIKIAF